MIQCLQLKCHLQELLDSFRRVHYVERAKLERKKEVGKQHDIGPVWLPLTVCAHWNQHVRNIKCKLTENKLPLHGPSCKKYELAYHWLLSVLDHGSPSTWTSDSASSQNFRCFFCFFCWDENYWSYDVVIGAVIDPKQSEHIGS